MRFDNTRFVILMLVVVTALVILLYVMSKISIIMIMFDRLSGYHVYTSFVEPNLRGAITLMVLLAAAGIIAAAISVIKGEE